MISLLSKGLSSTTVRNLLISHSKKKKCRLSSLFFLLSLQTHAPFHFPMLLNSSKVVHIPLHSHQIFHQFIFLKEFPWPRTAGAGCPAWRRIAVIWRPLSSIHRNSFGLSLGSDLLFLILYSFTFWVYTQIWVETLSAES